MSSIDESSFSKFSLEPEFPNSFHVYILELTEYDKFNISQKGYLFCSYLEHEKKLYPLHFYEPVSLCQGFRYSDYIAEPGSIVIPRVTHEVIIPTLKKLLKKGYFDYQKDYTLEELCKLCDWWHLLDEYDEKIFDKQKYHGVWVYNASRAMFPCAVFDTKQKALEWIAKNKVSGCLTLYPLNKSVYDWAIENQIYTPKKPLHFTPKYIGIFTSDSLEHYHFEFYENGELNIKSGFEFNENGELVKTLDDTSDD
jgi:hypothetical protein